MKRAFIAVALVFGATALFSEEEKTLSTSFWPDENWGFSGCLWNVFETAYVSSSGTLCDTKPVSMQNLDWDFAMGDYGHFWGYGCFLGTLHDAQHEMHRAAFNEFEGGLFYGYDWKLSDDVTFCNSAGGVWNPLFGYRNGYEDTLWEYRYFQSLENPYVTPFWDILGLISPTPSWARIRLGLRHSFHLTDTLILTPCAETVWADRDRYLARTGELPRHRFLGGGFATITVSLKLEWYFTEHWSVWAIFKEYIVVDEQERETAENSPNYWAKKDLAIGSLGFGYHF